MINIDKIEARVNKMSEGQLLAWLEAAIPGMQRHLEQYQNTRNPDHLGELAIAEMTAGVVVTELMTRRFPGPVVAEAETTPVPTAPSEPSKDTGTTSARKRFLGGLLGRTGSVNVRAGGTIE